MKPPSDFNCRTDQCDARPAAAEPKNRRHRRSLRPVIGDIACGPKLTFAGLGLAVGLVLATATQSQAGTTSTTVFRIQSGDVEYTAAAVGNIGLNAQSAGATIEYTTSTLNAYSTRVNGGGQTGAGIWLDIDAPHDFYDRFIETSGSIVTHNVTSEADIVRVYLVAQGTITFSPLLPATDRYPFEHFEVTPDRGVAFIVPGDAVITLGLKIHHTERDDPELDPDVGLVRIDFTSDGPLPKLPRQFTDEQKAKFKADADALKKNAALVSAFSGTLSSNPAASLSNLAASQVASSISPQVGTVNSALQTALSQAESALSHAPTNPISLIFSLTGMLNQSTVSILEFLANDPPDGNYLEVFDAPDWSFGDIEGASAVGNALVQDSWALFQESLNLLAAAERFQGADLADDADARAMQEAAFDAALDQYNQNRVTLSDSLTAFLTEIEADPDVEDLNLKNDTSLADLQAYLTGLADPASEDAQLAALIASITEALPGLQAQPDTNEPSFIEQAVIDALEAIENAPPSRLTGSAFAAIRASAASLAKDLDSPPEISARSLTSVILLAGEIVIAIDSEIGLTYQLQTWEESVNTVWLDVGEPVPGDGAKIQFQRDVTDANTATLFRIRIDSADSP